MFSHVPRKHRGVRWGGVMCAKNGWSKEGQWRNLQGHRAHLGVRFANPAIVIDNLPERGRGKGSVNNIGAERWFLSHPRVALRSRCWQTNFHQGGEQMRCPTSAAADALGRESPGFWLAASGQTFHMQEPRIYSREVDEGSPAPGRRGGWWGLRGKTMLSSG